MRMARECIRYCTEVDRAPVYNFRREFVDLVAISLNHGVHPIGFVEVVERADEEFNVAPHEVKRLVDEIEEYRVNNVRVREQAIRGGTARA